MELQPYASMSSSPERQDEESKVIRTRGSLKDETRAEVKESKRVFRKRVIASLGIFAAFITFGFLNAQKGPSLLDLELITNTNTDLASTFFTSGGVGALLGVALAGALFDRYHRGRFQFGASLLVLSILQAVTPLISSYIGMMAMFFVSGVVGGFANSSANSEMMRLWRHRAGPFMEALHFFYAIGSQFSPLVTAPFLAPQSPDPNATEIVSSQKNSRTDVTSSWYEVTSSTYEVTSYNVTSFPENVTSAVVVPVQETRVLYAFIIAAVFSALASAPLLMPCLSRNVVPVAEESPVDSDRDIMKKKRPRLHYVVAGTVIAAFCFIYAYLEICFENFLLAFVVKHHKWHKDMAAYLTTVYWASFATMRFAGIFFIRYVSPVKVLVVCCGCLVLSFSGFTLSAIFNVRGAIWPCIVATGLSMSVQFPTAILLIERHFFPVTGIVTTLVFISAMAGSMAMPPVFGVLMTDFGQLWFCYLLDIGVVVLAVLLIVLLVMSKTVFAPKDEAKVISMYGVFATTNFNE